MTETPENTPPKNDPIANFILDILADGKSYTFKDMAMRIFEARRKAKDRPDGWQRFMNTVKQQTIYLARQGSVEIMRKGKVADPNDFKGIVRVRRIKT